MAVFWKRKMPDHFLDESIFTYTVYIINLYIVEIV